MLLVRILTCKKRPVNATTGVLAAAGEYLGLPVSASRVLLTKASAWLILGCSRGTFMKLTFVKP